jgi:hypothetical protein
LLVTVALVLAGAVFTPSYAAKGRVALASGTSVVRAPAGNALRESVTVATANIPHTLTPWKARKQLNRVLAQGPDVVLLQEMRDRPTDTWAALADGKWGVIDGDMPSPIVYDSSVFSVVQSGSELGFDGVEYDRYMTWAVLQGKRSQIAVVAMHLPPEPTTRPRMKRYYRIMANNYRVLATRLREAGYPVVMGADWNRPLHVAAESWAPVLWLAGMNMTTNWVQGWPCEASSIHGGRIDGFGFDPQTLSIQEQGCWPHGPSDHRPVWMRIGPR